MIGTVVKGFFLILSGFILLVGLSPTMQRSLDRHHLIPNQYVFGDLYNITNLRAFRETDFTENTNLIKTDEPAKHYQDVHVYTIGDSFTDIDTSYYAGGRNVHVWAGGTQPTVAPLDITRKNILVIEFIERILQERLYTPHFERIYVQNGIVQPAQPTTLSPQPIEKNEATAWLFTRLGSEINQRLEFILFNSPFFMWFKELKAQLLLSGFGRVSGAVVSHNQRHVFYEPEVDTKFVLSAFHPISNRKLDTLVTNLNTIRQHYLGMGFNEVYICMIPNKVTILEPTYGPYNHQIERIEAHPHLNVPTISMIDTLRRHPEWYHLGDGHWNRLGKKYWLSRVNETARQWSASK